jgi:hypothetical protein
MKGIVFGLMIFVLGFGLVNALDSQEFETFCQDIDMDQFAEFSVPSFAPYKNEIFNFYITEENLSGSMTIEERKIVSIKCEKNEDNTYDVYIDNLKTIEEIGESEDFLDIYNKKIKNKEIKIKGATLGKKIKLTFTQIILKIISWFK